MQPSHSLRQANERLKLAYGVAIGCLRRGSILVRLTKFLVLILEDKRRFFRELRLERTANFDVCLELLHGKVRVKSTVLEPVHVYNVPSNMKVLIVVFFVKDHKEQIEARHNWRRDVNVVSERL